MKSSSGSLTSRKYSSLSAGSTSAARSLRDGAAEDEDEHAAATPAQQQVQLWTSKMNFKGFHRALWSVVDVETKCNCAQCQAYQRQQAARAAARKRERELAASQRVDSLLPSPLAQNAESATIGDDSARGIADERLVERPRSSAIQSHMRKERILEMLFQGCDTQHVRCFVELRMRREFEFTHDSRFGCSLESYPSVSLRWACRLRLEDRPATNLSSGSLHALQTLSSAE